MPQTWSELRQMLRWIQALHSLFSDKLPNAFLASNMALNSITNLNQIYQKIFCVLEYKLNFYPQKLFLPLIVYSNY